MPDTASCFTELGGDRVADKHHHPIRANLDAYPEVFLDAPAQDVELRENQTIDIHWRAQDDFGISDVQLAVDLQDQNNPIVIPLPSDDTGHHGGVYHWSLASLRLAPGTEAQFYITVTTTTPSMGPKKPIQRVVACCCFRRSSIMKSSCKSSGRCWMLGSIG